ncbi:MAG: hypothetical protein NVSMB57_03890 [Actinomycetota bacterium]
MDRDDQAAEVESITRRGEDHAKNEKEAGRFDKGTEGQSQRPTGGSTSRDRTGVDPQEPIDEESTAK